MVQISKKRLPKEIIAKLFLLFFETVGKKNKHEEFQLIIDDILSETEQIMIIKRIAIIYLQLKEIDNPVIAEVLNVSPATVCKFSSTVKRDEGIIHAIKIILQKEKISQFFEDVFYELFTRPGTYGSNWSRGWQYKFRRERVKSTGL